ncbi:MAG: hypothetical protein K9G62_04755 [Alphaproteobacteria bacterium]|nr:hypothetical protein [Alphaproteobacteria bacterium]
MAQIVASATINVFVSLCALEGFNLALPLLLDFRFPWIPFPYGILLPSFMQFHTPGNRIVDAFLHTIVFHPVCFD